MFNSRDTEKICLREIVQELTYILTRTAFVGAITACLGLLLSNWSGVDFQHSLNLIATIPISALLIYSHYMFLGKRLLPAATVFSCGIISTFGTTFVQHTQSFDQISYSPIPVFLSDGAALSYGMIFSVLYLFLMYRELSK